MLSHSTRGYASTSSVTNRATNMSPLCGWGRAVYNRFPLLSIAFHCSASWNSPALAGQAAKAPLSPVPILGIPLTLHFLFFLSKYCSLPRKGRGSLLNRVRGLSFRWMHLRCFSGCSPMWEAVKISGSICRLFHQPSSDSRVLNRFVVRATRAMCQLHQ